MRSICWIWSRSRTFPWRRVPWRGARVTAGRMLFWTHRGVWRDWPCRSWEGGFRPHRLSGRIWWRWAGRCTNLWIALLRLTFIIRMHLNHIILALSIKPYKLIFNIIAAYGASRIPQTKTHHPRFCAFLHRIAASIGQLWTNFTGLCIHDSWIICLGNQRSHLSRHWLSHAALLRQGSTT